MVNAEKLAEVGCRYLGTPYSVMDCQAFVEKCLSDCGESKNLAGSNAWYREVKDHGWVGSPEECKKRLGEIPQGAFLFILEMDGKEPDKYKPDGIGNASHIGIYTGMTGAKMVEIARQSGNEIAGGFNYGNGAINSSSSRGAVCTSKFSGVSISGGWNRVGLWDRVKYWGIDGGDDSVEVNWMGKVIGGKLNMRSQPSKDSERIGQIPDGEIVTVTEEQKDGSWGLVSYGGRTGWVMTAFLTEIKPENDDDIVVSRGTLMAIYDTLGDMLGLRG